MMDMVGILINKNTQAKTRILNKTRTVMEDMSIILINQNLDLNRFKSILQLNIKIKTRMKSLLSHQN